MKFVEFTEYNTTLNPKLWEGRGSLRSDVRGALLRIAEDFREFCEVEFPVLDIVITGSNVNYNYNNKSDLDLHLITDYDQIDCDQELEELFDSKRRLYEQERDVSIRGIPVTLYVEDRRRPGVSQGLYSVEKNQWLQQPSKQRPRIDTQQVSDQQQMWQTILTKSLAKGDLPILKTVLKLVRQYRKQGLKQAQGEFSTANIVYKQLRNLGLLDQLQDRVNDLVSKNLSIKE